VVKRASQLGLVALGVGLLAAGVIKILPLPARRVPRP